MTVDASEKPAQYRWLGAGVVIGLGCAMIAALYPGLSSIWTAHGIDAVTRIAHHRDAWQVANRMFAVSTAFTVAGLAVLTAAGARLGRVHACDGCARARHRRLNAMARDCGRAGTVDRCVS